MFQQFCIIMYIDLKTQITINRTVCSYGCIAIYILKHTKKKVEK